MRARCPACRYFPNPLGSAVPTANSCKVPCESSPPSPLGSAVPTDFSCKVPCVSSPPSPLGNVPFARYAPTQYLPPGGRCPEGADEECGQKPIDYIKPQGLIKPIFRHPNSSPVSPPGCHPPPGGGCCRTTDLLRRGRVSRPFSPDPHKRNEPHCRPGGETPPLRILSIHWRNFDHYRRGRVSRPFSPDQHNGTNRAGQGKNDYLRTKHELAARPAGRRGRVSRPIFTDFHNVTNRAGQGKNDYLRTKHELAARPAGRRGRGCNIRPLSFGISHSPVRPTVKPPAPMAPGAVFTLYTPGIQRAPGRRRFLFPL